MNQDLEYLRQLHEPFLADLEGLAVEAIASNNWDAFYAHVVDFQSQQSITLTITLAEAKELFDLLDWKNDPQFKSVSLRLDTAIAAETSTKDLHGPGAGFLPKTEVNES